MYENIAQPPISASLSSKASFDSSGTPRDVICTTHTTCPGFDWVHGFRTINSDSQSPWISYSGTFSPPYQAYIQATSLSFSHRHSLAIINDVQRGVRYHLTPYLILEQWICQIQKPINMARNIILSTSSFHQSQSSFSRLKTQAPLYQRSLSANSLTAQQEITVWSQQPIHPQHLLSSSSQLSRHRHHA